MQKIKLNSIETHISNEQVPYSPGALLHAFSNSMSSPLLSIPVTIKGIYKKGKGVNYNGLYYDIIKDEFSDTNITLVVAERLRLNLKEGQLIEAYAYVNKRLSTTSGRIDLILTVTDILSRKEKFISEEETKFLELIQRKAKLGYKDVDGLIRSKLYNQVPVTICIVIGTTAIIDNDIKQQLRDAAIGYEISYVKVNLTRVSEIIQVLKENDNNDILIVSRGGGENIQVFNNLELSEQTFHLRSAFVTAIGHADDEPLLQKIADKYFITPTALGQYLYDAYNRTLEELNNSKAKLISDLSKQIELSYQYKIQDLNIRLEATTKSLQDEKKENELKLERHLQIVSKTKTVNHILYTLLIILMMLAILYFAFIKA